MKYRALVFSWLCLFHCLWVLRLECAFRSFVPRLTAFEPCRTFLFSCRELARKWLSLLPLTLTETASTCAEIAMASETRTRIALGGLRVLFKRSPLSTSDSFCVVGGCRKPVLCPVVILWCDTKFSSVLVAFSCIVSVLCPVFFLWCDTEFSSALVTFSCVVCSFRRLVPVKLVLSSA